MTKNLKESFKERINNIIRSRLGDDIEIEPYDSIPDIINSSEKFEKRIG